ncbi:MAG: hypothetical protein J2P15_22435, partial [Micromonosporaceae bacterium]|nr:hypothetical protein [Micromonosporaceae bacterium]
SPHLAVLSAMAHGSRPDPDPVFEALLTALSVVDQDHADLYPYLVFAVLPQAARNRMEEFMTTTTHEYKSVFARRYYGDGKAEGKAEGEADAVLAVLDARGVEVPVQDRERIASCRDLDQLKAWVRRAATANKIQDLDEPAG